MRSYHAVRDMSHAQKIWRSYQRQKIKTCDHIMDASPQQSSTELQGSPAAFADYAADLLKQKSDFRIAIYCNPIGRCLPGNIAERCGKMIRGQGILRSLHQRFEAKLCYQHHPQAWQEFKITEDGRAFWSAKLLSLFLLICKSKTSLHMCPNKNQ